jgi:hypothetical protein
MSALHSYHLHGQATNYFLYVDMKAECSKICFNILKLLIS